MLIKDIVDQYKPAKTAAAQSTDLVKTAKEAGVEDGEKLLKLANHIGELIGTTAGNRAVEIIKQAFVAAEDNHSAVGGMNAQGSGQQAAAESEDDQVAQLALHHAELAQTAATDAADAMGRGDQHTATQQFATAANSLNTAKVLAARCSNTDVHAKVNAAAGVVGSHASAASAGAQ